MRVGPRTPTEPPRPALDVEAGEDHRALPQVLELVLRPDPDGDALVDQVAHQADDEVLVLEDLEEPATVSPAVKASRSAAMRLTPPT